MRDLKNSKIIYAKGLLFLALGIGAGVLLWIEKPTLKVALLLVVALWAFCRFYYFAFYVIGHYVDQSYRFSGLWSWVRYVWRNRRRGWQGCNEIRNKPE